MVLAAVILYWLSHSPFLLFFLRWLWQHDIRNGPVPFSLLLTTVYRQGLPSWSWRRPVAACGIQSGVQQWHAGCVCREMLGYSTATPLHKPPLHIHREGVSASPTPHLNHPYGWFWIMYIQVFDTISSRWFTLHQRVVLERYPYYINCLTHVAHNHHNYILVNRYLIFYELSWIYSSGLNQMIFENVLIQVVNSFLLRRESEIGNGLLAITWRVL